MVTTGPMTALASLALTPNSLRVSTRIAPRSDTSCLLVRWRLAGQLVQQAQRRKAVGFVPVARLEGRSRLGWLGPGSLSLPRSSTWPSQGSPSSSGMSSVVSTGASVAGFLFDPAPGSDSSGKVTTVEIASSASSSSSLSACPGMASRPSSRSGLFRRRLSIRRLAAPPHRPAEPSGQRSRLPESQRAERGPLTRHGGDRHIEQYHDRRDPGGHQHQHGEDLPEERREEPAGHAGAEQPARLRDVVAPQLIAELGVAELQDADQDQEADPDHRELQPEPLAQPQQQHQARRQHRDRKGPRADTEGLEGEEGQPGSEAPQHIAGGIVGRRGQPGNILPMVEEDGGEHQDRAKEERESDDVRDSAFRAAWHGSR